MIVESWMLTAFYLIVIELIGCYLYDLYMLNCNTRDWLIMSRFRKNVVCVCWPWHLIVFVYRVLMR